MKPEFVDDIFIYSSSSRRLYLNPEAPDWITIDEKYNSILDLIDGKNDISIIYDHINRFYYDEQELLTNQIKELLNTSKIFKHNQQKHCNTGKIVCNAPKNIYLTLTDSCNLKCVYCYATERHKEKDATFETWKKYVEEAIDFAKKPSFCFTGGEPLLIPYIFDLAEYIKERDCKCLLLTNGTLINKDEIAEKVASCFDLVKISLDSLDENISKELRGAGIVEKVRLAFNLLKLRNCNVQILATVTSKTNKNLDSFSANFNNQVNFQPFYQDMGRARNKQNLSISGSVYFDVLNDNGIFKILPGFSKNILSYRNNPYKRCAMANEEISIDADGNIYPCHMLHYENFLCGNLNKERISEIYKNSAVLKNLRTINVDTIPSCKVCVYRNFCGGACRARVDILKDGIKGMDNFCEFEQKSILDALLYSYG